MNGFVALVVMLAAIVGYACVGGCIIMLLWNYVIAFIFQLPAISLFQAIALWIICRILFGGSASKSGGTHAR